LISARSKVKDGFRKTLVDADMELEHSKPIKKRSPSLKKAMKFKAIKPVFKYIKYKRQLPTISF